MDGITIYGVAHNDLTAFNFRRFTGGEVETTQARSSFLRYSVVHGWRILDFDRSLRVDIENETARAKEDPAIHNSASVGCPVSFGGGCF